MTINIIILFLISEPINAIYNTYFKFIKILKEKNIEFFFHVNQENKIPIIINLLQNIITEKNITNDISSIINIPITHIFYKVCYNIFFPENLKSYNIKKIFKNSKICFYNYGYSMVNHKFLDNVGYNSNFFDHCDIYFIENKLNKEHYKKNILNKNIKFFDVGCLKLDIIKEKKIKKKNDCFYIMWCPRWNITNNLCSYNDYVDYFINFVNKNSKIKLIFRPHPLTNYSISKIVNASKENNRIIIDNCDNYNKHFKYIDIFICDPSSMIAEAFYYLIPIIYTKKVNNVFTEFGNKIEESFYSVKNNNELDIEINNLLKNKDRKKHLRQKFINIFYNIYKNPINKVISILQN